MGAWIETSGQPCGGGLCGVAPYVGAWIETQIVRRMRPCWWSLPTWERGLKLPCGLAGVSEYRVAPYVGAWIETLTRIR